MSLLIKISQKVAKEQQATTVSGEGSAEAAVHEKHRDFKCEKIKINPPNFRNGDLSAMVLASTLRGWGRSPRAPHGIS